MASWVSGSGVACEENRLNLILRIRQRSSPLIAVICAVRFGGSAAMASLAAFLYSRSSFSTDLS